MVSGGSSASRCTTDQRKGKDKIVDLHACETDISRTHVYRLCRPVDQRRWYQPKTSASILGGRREIGRVPLTDEEIREIAIQRVFVSSEDEFGCLGSCSFRQVHKEWGA